MDKGNSIVAHWQGDFDEELIAGWVKTMREKLQGNVSLGLVFVTPKFFNDAEKLLEIIRIYGRTPVLAGCSSTGLISNGNEIEDDDGFVVGLYHLPGAIVKGFFISNEDVYSAQNSDFWYQKLGLQCDESNGWLAFSDPFQFDSESWLQQWNLTFKNSPITGGIAGGIIKEKETQLYLDGEVLNGGCVAVSISGDVELKVVVSQGAKPIGESWTITKANQNIIFEIANMPAFDILVETFSKFPYKEQKKVIQNLLIGLAINEYREEFKCGDFIIRNLLGGDPKTGILAIGGRPRTGQSIQFQQRDPVVATQEIEELLWEFKQSIQKVENYGGCLFCCTGRGSSMFNEPCHDAKRVQKILGAMPVSGAFCNGEFGPVQNINCLHGYSASIALFTKKQSKVADYNSQ